MEDPTGVCKFTEFTVKLYTPFLKDVCALVLPFESSGVLSGSYVKEKCSCNQLAYGCVHMGVCLLVDVED